MKTFSRLIIEIVSQVYVFLKTCSLSIISQQRYERREGVKVERERKKEKEREKKGKGKENKQTKKQPVNLAIMREYRIVQIYTMAVMQ